MKIPLGTQKAIVLIIISLALTVTGCAQESTPQENLTNSPDTTNSSTTYIDDFDYRIRLNGTPDRIVSLAPSNTEMLYALGAGDKVVAVTDYCDYPSEAKENPKVGGYSTVNIEKVISMNPDVVIAAYGNGKQTVEFLKKYANVIALHPTDLEGVMEDIRLLGRITNEEENATKIINMMKGKIQKVKEGNNSYKSEEKEITVAHIVWHDPIWASGRNTFINQMIDLSGGENVFHFDGWRIVSKEDLLTRNPDVIIVNGGTGMSGQGESHTYNAIMEMENLKAVDKNNVYTINPDIVSRPSYRLVYALEKIENFLDKSN